MINKIFTIEELVCDESFVRFCTGKVDENFEYWKSLTKNNENGSQMFDSARELVLILSCSPTLNDMREDKKKLLQLINKDVAY
ncbi:hypothetical protein [Sphingobacterium sp. MYb388]|uniref:hypothetical protein n=1 Tax=Sphingobacterium sp. MYb388 TaxID=2745437 RepID=UPI0030A97CA7